ncbi:MAG TPA: DUF6644 family protein [Rhizobiaceae bacterium]|nr:DUF6644 family protein [Rhizobiaceae bacterium]
MLLLQFFQALEASAVANWIRTSFYAQPLISALHLFGLTMVFGTISIVDLRLLGIPNAGRPFTVIAGELLRWTWLAFALTFVTGLLMFTTSAAAYYQNTPFRLKMLVLLLAGVNMLIFELLTVRSVERWNKDAPAPATAKVAGALSLLFWIGVICFGRWIGYTERYDFGVPADMNLDFLP